MTSDGLAACCPCSKTAKCKSVKCPCFAKNKPCASCASTLSGKCENEQHFHFSGSVEKLDEPAGKAVDGSPESGFGADSFVDGSQESDSTLDSDAFVKEKMQEAFRAEMVNEEEPIDDEWIPRHEFIATLKSEQYIDLHRVL